MDFNIALGHACRTQWNVLVSAQHSEAKFTVIFLCFSRRQHRQPGHHGIISNLNLRNIFDNVV